ncbi:MAG: hypothetical protein LBU60_02935 [Clostridiales bacterium]|nr:hypothetical protein [Clostridiales bacterium]
MIMDGNPQNPNGQSSPPQKQNRNGGLQKNVNMPQGAMPPMSPMPPMPQPQQNFMQPSFMPPMAEKPNQSNDMAYLVAAMMNSDKNNTKNRKAQIYVSLISIFVIAILGVLAIMTIRGFLPPKLEVRVEKREVQLENLVTLDFNLKFVEPPDIIMTGFSENGVSSGDIRVIVTNTIVKFEWRDSNKNKSVTIYFNAVGKVDRKNPYNNVDSAKINFFENRKINVKF